MKEYQSLAGQGVTAPGTQLEVSLNTGEHKLTRLGEVELHFTINGGVFSGIDRRELIAQAIDWWEKQLLALEATQVAA